MVGHAYRGLLHAGAVTAALLLGVVAALVTLDVVARNVGLGTLPWILEVSEYSLPLATFLIAPWLLHQGQHVALDVVVAALPPAWARALDRLGNTIGLAVSLVFVLFGARTIAASAAQGSMVIKAIVFPEWWLYAPVPVCFALLAVEFARRLAGRGAPARPPG